MAPLNSYYGLNGNTLIKYHQPIGTDWVVTFETPNFLVPAGVHSLNLHFGRYGYPTATAWYEEHDYFTVTIINEPPTISTPSPATVIAYDDLKYWVDFSIADPEGSPLLTLRFTSTAPPWITIDGTSRILIAPV